MDLSDLFAAGQATIELKHPVTGKVLMDDSKPHQPLSLTVIGTHTKQYKEIARKIGFDAHKRNKNLKVDDMTFDEFCAAADANEGNELELQASAIVGCNIIMGGKKLECTKETMTELLSNESLGWIKNQYLTEVASGKVFFGS